MMKRKKLLIQRTLRSLAKYGAFLLIIATVVFACSNDAEDQNVMVEEPIANLTAKIDGAIMGSVIAPNSTIEIVASNEDKKITGTTDENGEFFITGFDEGIYTVTITTENTEMVETFQDVEVKIGEVTALGTVELAVQ